MKRFKNFVRESLIKIEMGFYVLKLKANIKKNI